MRCFLAFDFSEEDKKKIKKILKELLKTKKFKQLKEKNKIKVVQEKNYHITFLFFENLNETLKNKIIELMKKLSFLDLEVEIEKIDYFTTKDDKVKVIFLKISDSIFELINKYKKEFLNLDLDYERVKQLKNLKPHITLIRFKYPIDKRAIKDELEYVNKLIKDYKLTIKLNSFVLFKSTLLPTGPLYEKIFEIPRNLEKIK
jgi:2'-5' RNA ligase